MNIAKLQRIATVCYSMASVYLRPGSPYWMARFRDPSGKWIGKSTKETSRTKAFTKAHTWESGGKLLILESPQGAQFERVLRSLQEQITGKRMEANPAGEWLRKWVDTQTAQKAEKTGTRYNKVIEDFLATIGPEASALDLRTVTHATVQGFINREKLSGKSPTTVILNAKILRAAFNAALRAGILERNPAGVLELPDSAHNQREPFEPGEVAKLLKAAEGNDWETAIMLGRHIAMRLGDAVTLRKDAVDFAKGVIRYKPQKTARKGKVLTVPMTKELEKYLREVVKRDAIQASEFLCPTLHHRDIGGRAGLSAEFMALMDAAGIDASRIESKGGEGRAFSRKSFHSLRHTVASELANTNAPEKVARDILGHASAAMTDRYTHLEIGTTRKALEKSQKGGRKNA